MEFAFDFDGVFANTSELKARVAEHLYGLRIPPQHYKERYVIDEGFLTLAQARYVQNLVYNDPSIALSLRPMPGLIPALHALSGEGHTLRVVTSRSGDVLDHAMRWYRALPELTRDLRAIPFTGVGRDASKAEAVAGAIAYTDDDIHKLEEIGDAVPHLFLFHWEWNAHDDTSDITARISGWPDLLEHLLALH